MQAVWACNISFKAHSYKAQLEEDKGRDERTTSESGAFQCAIQYAELKTEKGGLP